MPAPIAPNVITATSSHINRLWRTGASAIWNRAKNLSNKLLSITGCLLYRCFGQHFSDQLLGDCTQCIATPAALAAGRAPHNAVPILEVNDFQGHANRRLPVDSDFIVPLI